MGLEGGDGEGEGEEEEEGEGEISPLCESHCPKSGVKSRVARKLKVAIVKLVTFLRAVLNHFLRRNWTLKLISFISFKFKVYIQ